MIQETRHSIVEILSRQPLFSVLSDAELQPIAAETREFRARKNEMVFLKGDMPVGMHVVVMGQVKLFIPSSSGAEKVVHMCGPGSTFGEAVVFLDKAYPVSAQATQDSIVLLVSKTVLYESMEANTVLCRKMLASLSMRLHTLLEDMETCTMRTSAQRVICFLNQLAPADAHAPFEIALPTSKQTIASQLSLAPETFSRVLGHLTEAGLIEVRGRSILVMDATKLRNYAV
ncbi:MAG: Crp/Fnr family transcriptional regulator [Betaproteobacteria bacterium]|nr:Crp/Fnr family transcriptional regulator [Betaproteobacteria bacterium]